MTRYRSEVTDNWNRVAIPQRVKKRAQKNVTRTPDGCWISDYSVGSHGYAQIGWQDDGEARRMVLAHRAAWELHNGPVPVSHTLDHLCRNKKCVNPKHLRVLENFENARRVNGMNWDLGQCANGHPNSMIILAVGTDKRGRRRDVRLCAPCRRLYGRRRNWKSAHPGVPMPDHLLLKSEDPATNRPQGEVA